MATSSEICLVCTMGAEENNLLVSPFDGCDHKFHQGCIEAAREQYIEGCPRCHEVNNSTLPSPSPPESLAQYEDAQVEDTVPAESLGSPRKEGEVVEESLGSPRKEGEVVEDEVAEIRTTESMDAPRMTEAESKSEPRITEVKKEVDAKASEKKEDAKASENKAAEAPEASGGLMCVCVCGCVGECRGCGACGGWMEWGGRVGGVGWVGVGEGAGLSVCSGWVGWCVGGKVGGVGRAVGSEG